MSTAKQTFHGGAGQPCESTEKGTKQKTGGEIMKRALILFCAPLYLAIVTSPQRLSAAERDLPVERLEQSRKLAEDIRTRIQQLKPQVEKLQGLVESIGQLAGLTQPSGQGAGGAQAQPGSDANASAVKQLAGFTKEEIAKIRDQLNELEAVSNDLQNGLGPETILREEGDEKEVEPPPMLTGTLILQNDTGVTQVATINGIRYQVPPGRSELPVPRAILEVYLPWYEQPKLWGMSNWRWTGQRYEMLIEIKPKARGSLNWPWTGQRYETGINVKGSRPAHG